MLQTTDRQTDRQTDKRATANSEREREFTFTFAKNHRPQTDGAKNITFRSSLRVVVNIVYIM